MFSLIAVLFIVTSAALILVPFTLSARSASQASRELPAGQGVDASRWIKSAQDHLRELADAA